MLLVTPCYTLRTQNKHSSFNILNISHDKSVLHRYIIIIIIVVIIIVVEGVCMTPLNH